MTPVELKAALGLAARRCAAVLIVAFILFALLASRYH
jgi:hypothetical protein